MYSEPIMLCKVAYKSAMRDALRNRFGFVHLDKELRHGRTEKSGGGREAGFLVQRRDEIIDHGCQPHRIGIVTAFARKPQSRPRYLIHEWWED